MKAFVSAQMTQEGLQKLAEYAEIKLGGWGHTGKKLTPEELVREAEDCDIMVICYEEINDYVLDHLPNIKFIACSRGGVENVDKEAVRRHQVFVTSSPGRNANAVAELTVGLMIDISRHISKTHYYIMSQQWDKVPWDIAGKTSFKTFDGYELQGKTVGLIGYGAIGRRVGRLLSGFDVHLIAYDPFLKEWPEGVESVSFDELLEKADIVSLHCKLSKKTKGILSEEAISKMKSGSVLINTARGALVNEEALIRALKAHKIGGAALDAQIHEPMLHDSELLQLDNVVLTPHIGGASRDIIAQQTKILLEDIVAYFETGKPIHVI